MLSNYSNFISIMLIIRRRIFPLVLCVLVVATAFMELSHAAGAADKKGYGLAESEGGSAQILSALKVHWYYNWGAKTRLKTKVPFVPMAFSIKHIDDIEPGNAFVLGFNEPDNEKQSNIAVKDALKAWPELLGKAAQVGAPAMAKNPLKPGNWLPGFMEKSPKVDFITVHWYKGAESRKFIADIQSLCDAYKKPVWVTEFAPQTASDSRNDPRRYTQAEVDVFILETTDWMERSDCVYRYAWHDSKVGTSALIQNGALTESGKTYASVRDK